MHNSIPSKRFYFSHHSSSIFFAISSSTQILMGRFLLFTHLNDNLSYNYNYCTPTIYHDTVYDIIHYFPSLSSLPLYLPLPQVIPFLPFLFSSPLLSSLSPFLSSPPACFPKQTQSHSSLIASTNLEELMILNP